jgi:hypothetical protein
MGSLRVSLWLDLLLLLNHRLGFLGCFWSANFIGICVVIRQPQPDLRHLE